jgi:hypothetical protein
MSFLTKSAVLHNTQCYMFMSVVVSIYHFYCLSSLILERHALPPLPNTSVSIIQRYLSELPCISTVSLLVSVRQV